ncbi:MAG: UDP-N-acetylmuramoyl-L-alanine--D-glutamate ligase [Rhabdochlamydiaceae bacterium]|nr:UDP-N-acetylmuramoyl-L-alanine--D-glutamate ligase [Rhabdochlamydiaceae bacterium]
MKRACVLGLGVSGLAAVDFLQSKGIEVSAADRKLPSSNDPQFQKVSRQGLTVFSDQAKIDLKGCDLFVLSPGISSEHPLVLQAKKLGIEIVGEAELALREIDQPAVAVTGTNGKTTVTLLTAHVLNRSGIKARALGNVGEPLSAYAMSPNRNEVLVVELSSYQLETLTARVFDAAVLLNITPDHLDRYRTMALYAQAKCRLQHCVKENGMFFVQTQAYEMCREWLSDRVQTMGDDFSSQLWTDKVVAKYCGNVEYFLPDVYRNLGLHESVNALAAWGLCKPFGVTAEQFIAALQTFSKPAHRIEYVAEIEGVEFFDDSKGTNVDAVIHAVEAMKGPVVLIVGGVDKGASYLPWKEHFQGKVKRLVAMGQAAQKIDQELSSSFNFDHAGSLSEAVQLAKACAEAGDCVLLSPGCSSFDMFVDYAHRGEEFKRAVLTLKSED